MSFEKVFLTDKIAKRIEKSVRSEDGTNLGYLLGYMYEDPSKGVHVVGAIGCDDAKRLALAQHKTSLLLPPGLQIVGIFIKTSQAQYKTIVEQVCQMVFPKELETAFSSPMVLYAAEKDEGCDSAVYSYNLMERTANPVQLENPTAPPLQNSLIFRLKASLDLQFQLNSDEDKQRENIVVEMYAIRARLLNPNTLYQVNDTNILLNGNGEAVKGGKIPYKQEIKTRDFVSMAGIWEKFGKKKNSANLSEVVVNVSILEDLTGVPVIGCSPVINHKHETFTMATVPLQLDVVSYVHDGEPINVWTGRLREGVDRQLEVITNCLLASCSKGENLYSPVPYHFLPSPLHHIFTLVYPDGAADNKLAERRRSIQHDFLLPVSRPYTKPANKHTFPDDALSGGYLTNVHEGLPSSGVSGGEVHIVDGTYSYHHYMQDRMNDDGWGCAYRSLQTLASWFRFQGYTEKAIPTHSQIQQVLVDIGDKPPKFVNSRQWIGSMEVSYVLNTLLEVESKTLYVSTGADLANKGRELAQHFDTQGTPIMIGGGVLAHTILGVCFNDTTGELKFLILDPHYKGGEDLKVIQDKGWCGWKGVDFWDQNAYYNLCMPQRPAMV